MKTIVQTGIRRLELVHRPEPTIAGANEVLFKVEAVGVCGSDIHYYRSGQIGSKVVQYPFPLGHECSGTVVAVGPAVEKLRPGDRIAVDPAVRCGACDQCSAGRPHTCRRLLFLGCPGELDGCLSEYYALPDFCCFKVSTNTSLERAALVEPLSIGCYAVQLAQLTPGMKVGILGLGPIGFSVLVAARARGLDWFCVTDPLAYRRELALAHGARAGCDPHAEDPLGALGGELDVVFECCGQQSALADACRLLAPGGKLVIIGIPEAEQICFDPHLLRRAEIAIHNVRRQNGCMQAAIDLIESAAIDLNFLHTHTFPLAATSTAFELVDGYRDQVVKAVVLPPA
jgi:L-iditol 2-dehydrogenase